MAFYNVWISLKISKIKLVEDKDTAETARRIQEKQLKGIAAIASVTPLYDLEILLRFRR
jgi:prephenate dehydratase